MVPLLALGAGVLASSIGAAAAGNELRKDRKESNAAYRRMNQYLDAQNYRDPLSTTGNKALLKSLSERMQDSYDAMENRAAAGGATMENQLAARQANNETMSGVYTNLLQNEDARKDAIAAQKMQLDQQHSADIRDSYRQNAQNWGQWGSAMGNAAMSLGSSALLAKSNGMSYKDMFKW